MMLCFGIDWADPMLLPLVIDRLNNQRPQF